MIRNPSNFNCGCCGNNILAMDWDDIRHMLCTYRECVGPKAFSQLSLAIGMPYHTLTYYARGSGQPRYQQGRKLALYLKGEFQAMPAATIHRFNQLYHKAL